VFYASAYWRTIRARFLLLKPLCSHESCIKPAWIVDHIIPRSRGGGDDFANLAGYCSHAHHTAKTNARDGGYGNPMR
jgi:5-methylcytosine-specific restriction endonuclease McrA